MDIKDAIEKINTHAQGCDDLNLASKSLTDPDIDDLITALNNVGRVAALRLRNNTLGDESATRLADCTSLTTLDLMKNPNITSNGIRAFKDNKHLTHLHITETDIEENTINDVKNRIAANQANADKLHQACMAGNIEDARRYLMLGARPYGSYMRRKLDNKSTLLHQAVLKNNHALYHLLVAHGALIEQGYANEDGQSVQALAVFKGFDINAREPEDAEPLTQELLQMLENAERQMQALEERNAALQAQLHRAQQPYTYDDTKLREAIKVPESTLVQNELKRGGVLTEHRVQGYTLLHLAAREGRVDIVESLLKHGAVLEATDGFGSNVSRLATAAGISNQLTGMLVHFQRSETSRETCLHGAINDIKRGDNESEFLKAIKDAGKVLEEHLKAGAVVNARSASGHSPLSLLINKITADFKITDSAAQPIKDALCAIIRILIEHGAQLHVFPKDGQFKRWTSMPYALCKDNAWFLKELYALESPSFASTATFLEGVMMADELYVGQGHIPYHPLEPKANKLLLDAAIDRLVGALWGARIDKVMKSEALPYLSHAVSLINFKPNGTLPDKFVPVHRDVEGVAEVVRFEGFAPTRFLLMRLRILLGFLAELKQPAPASNTAPELRQKQLQAISSEFHYTLTAFYHSVVIFSIKSARDDGRDWEALRDGYCDSFEKQIIAEDDKSLPLVGDCEYGESGHTFYVHFSHNQGVITVRLDNLGAAMHTNVEEKPAHPSMKATTSKGKQDIRYAACVRTFNMNEEKSKDNFKSFLAACVDCCTKRHDKKEEGLQAITNIYWLLCSGEELTPKVPALFPYKKIQSTGNCTMKNWHAGMHLRFRQISGGDALYRWYRAAELGDKLPLKTELENRAMQAGVNLPQRDALEGDPKALGDVKKILREQLADAQRKNTSAEAMQAWSATAYDNGETRMYKLQISRAQHIAQVMQCSSCGAETASSITPRTRG